jgi:hypothetical protein
MPLGYRRDVRQVGLSDLIERPQREVAWRLRLLGAIYMLERRMVILDLIEQGLDRPEAEKIADKMLAR